MTIFQILFDMKGLEVHQDIDMFILHDIDNVPHGK